MNIANLKSGVSIAVAQPFAHLFGRGSKVATKAKTEDDKKPEDEKTASEEDGDEKEKAAAKEGEEECDAEDGDPDDDKKPASKKAKKAKADAEDGDDDDGDKEEMKAQGAKAERARWTGVLKGSAAVGRVEAALNMLAMTEMSAPEISGVLATLPVTAAKSGDLGTRMSDAKIPNPGDGGRASGLSPTDPKAIAAAVLAAGKKARGEA